MSGGQLALYSDLCTVHILVSMYFVKGVIQHGKEEYESLTPGTVQLQAAKGSTDIYVHRSSVF